MSNLKIKQYIVHIKIVICNNKLPFFIPATSVYLFIFNHKNSMKRMWFSLLNPESLVIGHSYKLIMYGNKICIKGKYDVTGYSENSVMLRCDRDVVCIKGEGVVISSLDVNEIYISGKITEISFS